MSYFEKLHPAVAFCYFAVVIFVTMFTLHPFAAVISFVLAFSFCGMLQGWRRLAKSLAFSLPMLLFFTLMNPLFVHKGETVLFFLNDMPITQEALIYGFVSALVLLAVFYWFSALHEVMTTDKTVYLFGRVLPKLSLVLSMSLAAFPRVKKQYRDIAMAQKALGIYGGNSFSDRLKGSLRIFSALITMALESSITTADSMRARGYGLKGRSAFASYRFTAYDAVFLVLCLLWGGVTVVLLVLGYGDYTFYPTLSSLDGGAVSLLLWGCLILLGALSTFFEGKENLAWRILQSKI